MLLPVPDRIFDEPRLADLYDDLDSDRADLDAYVAIAEELEARTVVDVGCGTGVLACLLANAGMQVVGVDPAEAMLAVARRRPGGDLVHWVHGVARDLPPTEADLATMTGNVAQVFLDDDEWVETLASVWRALRAGGSFLFESRRPEAEAWLEWNPDASFTRVEIEGVGVVETWNEVIDVSLPFVTFRGTIVFHADGTELVSESTLRFRTRDEIGASLDAAGFDVDAVCDAPDRPGKEFVFRAHARA